MTKVMLIGRKVMTAYMPERLLIGRKLVLSIQQFILNEIYSSKILNSTIV